MPRKLSDAQTDAIRAAWDDGRPAADVAAEYDISPRHVSRLWQEREGDRGPALPLDQAESSEQAVRVFLDSLKLENTGDRVLAAAALTVAKKLDKADARATAGLASRLQELVGELRRFSSEPDELSLLKRRRALRRARVS